jgi:hypothetical protein
MVARKTGPVARLRAGLRAFTEALDYSGFDYALDRIGNAEREIARLKALLEGAGVNTASSNENHGPRDRVSDLEHQVALLRDELRMLAAASGAGG